MSSPSPSGVPVTLRRVAVTGAPGMISSAILRACIVRLSSADVVMLLDQTHAGAADSASEPATQEPSVTAESAVTAYVDLTSPDLVSELRGTDVLVHVAVEADLADSSTRDVARRRSELVHVSETVLTAAAASGVRHVVVLSSARVYGAHADNPVPLPDDAPLRASELSSVGGDLLVVEDVVERARETYPGMLITVIRPAALVGLGADTAVMRHFAAPRLLTVRGTTPAWQFCHVDDLAAAVVVVIAQAIAPFVTVGCDGYLTQEQLEEISGMRHVEVTSAMAMGTAARLHRVGVLSMPPADLEYVQHPWVIDAQRLRAAGWRAAHSNEECVRELVDRLESERSTPLLRKEMALGAASAAVAMVATAAIMRRRRSR